MHARVIIYESQKHATRGQKLIITSELAVIVVQSSLSNPAPFATAFSAGLTRVLD